MGVCAQQNVNYKAYLSALYHLLFFHFKYFPLPSQDTLVIAGLLSTTNGRSEQLMKTSPRSTNTVIITLNTAKPWSLMAVSKYQPSATTAEIRIVSPTSRKQRRSHAPQATDSKYQRELIGTIFLLSRAFCVAETLLLCHAMSIFIQGCTKKWMCIWRMRCHFHNGRTEAKASVGHQNQRLHLYQCRLHCISEITLMWCALLSEHFHIKHLFRNTNDGFWTLIFGSQFEILFKVKAEKSTARSRRKI